MGEMETLGILEEIQSLVSDKLQVVSYKWLSRNFLVSSNSAKRLLQEFVKMQGTNLEVVYSLSGWLRDNPASYHIRLVSGPKLDEAKQKFEGNCSVHIYSVQACIPKDPALLWNAEFVQAEELFKQPFTIDNCLRDNRFCGILNSFVKRNVDGTPVSTTASLTKSVGISKTSSDNQNITVPPSLQTKVKQSSPEVGQSLPNVVKDVKIEITGTGGHYQSAKPSADTEKVPSSFTDKKTGQNDKTSSGNGGSLVNLWGRASAKSRPSSASADSDNLISNPSATAEAQIYAGEAIEDATSDEEPQDVYLKRASNGENIRKRRVVLDYSDDEYEDAVNLASPDLPKGKISEVFPSVGTNLNEQKEEDKAKVGEEKFTNRASNQILRKHSEDKPKLKEEKSTDMASNLLTRKDSLVVGKHVQSDTVLSEKIHNHNTEDGVKENRGDNAASTSPKRRKVLKTRIDERGREVTEVVWEGDETETKKADSSTTRSAENNAITSTVHNRAPATKKSPAIGNAAPSNQGGKAGNKKGGNKDPKQGNILSFFKRV